MSEPTELSTALIAGLAVQANNLAEAAQDLRESYRFSRTLKFVIIIGFLMMVGLTLIAIQNRENGQATRQSITTIKDCTTPGGMCYQRSQKATGEAVAQIVAGVNQHTDLVLIATLECSQRYRRDPDFVRCLRSKGIR